MTIPVGTRLGAYEVLASLGAGGMGEVYRARDARLRRDVAIKVVPEHLAQDAAALSRFRSEAQTVAGLSHPNVVALFDVGQQQDVHYLVMELLEGETLRQRLARGRLPVKAAVDLALQAARGLGAAHAKGVVHRDLKPENIVLTHDGFLKILDFGLAKQAEEPEPGGGTHSPTLQRRTEPGTLLGTVGYMAPEQAQGLEADARSDVFALGAILYEMLTGERAFEAGSRAEVLAAVLRDEPPGLERLEREASPALARLVERCLRKSRGERFQGAQDVAFALEAVATSSSASGREAAPRAPEAGTSIAVLPFANMSPDPDTEYFSDGMTEEIINALGQIPDLRVAARTSSFAFKGKNLDLREVSEKLGVSTLLEGSVRRAGSRVRITAQLVDAKGGHHLWSERYDRELSDVFAIQDEIARAIAERLEGTLGRVSPEARPETRTRSPEAYDLYLKGRYLFNRRASPQAIAKLEEALEHDPGFVPALTALSNAYGIHAFYGGIDTRVAFERARRALERARELDPGSPDVWISSAIIEHYFGWDFEEEERLLRDTLRLAPRAADAHYWLAMLLGLAGRTGEALAAAREAARLEPLDPHMISAAAWPLFVAGRFEEACAEARRGLDLDPNAVFPLVALSRCLASLGDAQAAVAATERLVAVTERRLSLALGALAWAHAADGRPEDARAVLAELDEREATEYVAPSHRVLALVTLGDIEAAYAAATRGADERNGLAWWWIRHDPGCAALRAHPDYAALEARLGSWSAP